MPKTVGNFKIIVDNDVTDEIVSDLCSAAFYGGITYWCDRITVKGGHENMTGGEALLAGKTLRLHEIEEDKWHELTLYQYIQGLKKYCEDRLVPLTDVHENHDAFTGDSIIQFALFGEEIYG